MTPILNDFIDDIVEKNSGMKLLSISSLFDGKKYLADTVFNTSLIPDLFQHIVSLWNNNKNVFTFVVTWNHDNKEIIAEHSR